MPERRSSCLGRTRRRLSRSDKPPASGVPHQSRGHFRRGAVDIHRPWSRRAGLRQLPERATCLVDPCVRGRRADDRRRPKAQAWSAAVECARLGARALFAQLVSVRSACANSGNETFRRRSADSELRPQRLQLTVVRLTELQPSFRRIRIVRFPLQAPPCRRPRQSGLRRRWWRSRRPRHRYQPLRREQELAG